MKSATILFLSLCSCLLYMGCKTETNEAPTVTITTLLDIPYTTGTIADTMIAARLLHNADVLSYEGAFIVANETIDKSIEIYKRYIGEDNELVVGLYARKATLQYQMDSIPNAIDLANSSIEWLEKRGIQNEELVKAYIIVAGVTTAMGNFVEANNLIKKVENIAINSFSVGHPALQNVYNLKGWYFNLSGNYKDAIVEFKKAIDICRTKTPERKLMLSRHYLGIAAAYEGWMDISNAISYYEAAVAIIETLPKADDNVRFKTFNNFGNSLVQFEEYGQALSMLNKAQELTKPNSPFYFNILYGKGTAQLKLSKFSEAVETFTKAASYLPMYNPKHISCLDYLAEAEAGNWHLEKAISYQASAIEIAGTVLGKQNPDFADYLYDMAKYKFMQGELTEAQYWLSRTFESLKYDPNDSLFYENEVSPVTLLLALNLESKIIQQRNHEIHSQSLKNVITETTSKYLKTLNYIKNRLTSEQSKMFLAEITHPIFEDAINTYYVLGHQKNNDIQLNQTAFHIAENSKASILLAASKEADFFKFAGLPDSLPEKEQMLRSEMSRLEMELVKLQNNDSSMQDITNKILNQKREHDIFVKSLENNYPDYYQLKYANTPISIKGIQDSLLNHKQALVEYFVGDSSIYIFVVLKNKYTVKAIKKDFPLKEWVQQLRDNISINPGEYQGKGDLIAAEYVNAASNLYKKLFSPIDSMLPENAEIILVPDGELNYIPFEALLVERPNNPAAYAYHHYLLKDHQISYAYSATLLKEMRFRKFARQPTKNLLAFAPMFKAHKNNGQWGDLNNGSGVENICDKVEGLPLVGVDANKKHLEASGGEYRIIHFATHAVADDKTGDYAFMVFSSPDDENSYDTLFNRELYNFRLNADMVTLSACKTGVGELKRGEGIISLARGFSYAGAKSIVTTLWKAEDRSSNIIMEHFYRNLKAGMSKDAALRKSKLDFLPAYAKIGNEPYYWASSIAIGDMSPIAFSEIKSKMPAWAYIVAAVTMFISIYLWLIINKKHHCL